MLFGVIVASSCSSLVHLLSSVKNIARNASGLDGIEEWRLDLPTLFAQSGVRSGFLWPGRGFTAVFLGKVIQGLTKESKRCILNKRLRKRLYTLMAGV